MQQQQQKTLACRSNTAFYVVGLLAVFVYVNTLIGDFTFDDNFAVITNGDVTNNNNPVPGLFKHDFWGQDITSSQSHKSYRPVTILAFRLTRQAWDAVQLLVPGINSMLPSPPQQPHQQQQKQHQDTFSAKSPRPAGLHAFPFHVLSVVLHALVSLLVLALAQHLFAKLESAAGWASSYAASSSSELAAATAGGVYGGTGSSSSIMLGRLLMWQHQPELWLRPGTWAGQAQALIAAVLFALHPAHTEAVAGVVGCAELICAAWSIPALLLYFMAVDGRYAAAAAAAAVQQHQQQQQQHDASTVKAAGKHSGSKAKQQSKTAAAAGAAAAADAAAATDSEWLKLVVADRVQHWLLVLAAAGLAVLAALSKEIGITITGTMVLYDLLLAPHMLNTAAGAASSNTKGDNACESSKQQQQRRGACREQLLRVLLLAVVTVGYIKLRSWVAVQQLVDIYRKVENPIPFAKSFSTRLFTTGFLHARYLGTLLFPLHLSADWSFSCIPLVEQLTDPRNAATAALYLYFLYVGLSARPLLFLRQLWGVASSAVLGSGTGGSTVKPASSSSSNQGHADGSSSSTTDVSAVAAAAADKAAVIVDGRLGHARWRLMVVVGLLIAPYFPASNVLFYVGTFIGERLLYFPSIGYCLLVADLLGWLLRPHSAAQAAAAAVTAQQEQQQRLQSSSQSEPVQDGQSGAANADASPAAPNATQSSRSNAPYKLPGAVLAMLLVVIVCCGYAVRTLLRNADWWDEERLFLAAEQVCPNSAKVQQNCGVLQRRYQNFSGAMKHFKRAQEIEPGYCEPSYWIALTRINQGEVLAGIAAMKASLGCKYTAAEALQTLNRLYVMMHDNTPGDPMPMLEWGGVLASRDVLRVADGCATVEDAALMAALAGKSANYITQALDVCFQGLQHWEEGDTQPDTLASLARDKYRSLNATLLRQCVTLRRVVYKKLATADPKSQAAKKTLYKYISKVQQHHPGCRSLAGGGNAPVEGPDGGITLGPSSHQKLLHRFQSADPEDPWLQLEWGETMLALGGLASLRDAAMHLEVSSAIFNHIVQELQADSTAKHKQPAGQQKGQSARAKQLAGYTALDGKTALTPVKALEAAMLPLEQFTAAAVNATSPASRELSCEMLKRLCHLRLQMVVLVQQQQQSASNNGAGGGSSGANGGSSSSNGGVTAGLRQASSMKAVLNAKAAGRRCLVELSERRGCEQQAEEIRRLIGRGTD